MPRMKWIEEGLRFSCTSCGNCCKGPGYVWVDESDIRAMAEVLEMEPDAFSRRYVRRTRGRLSLTETGPDDRCVLLGDDDKCRVYDVRPRQCRTFPFWPEAMKKRHVFESFSEYCPGIGKGRLYTEAEIREILDDGKPTG